jgi:hypothetical protein
MAFSVKLASLSALAASIVGVIGATLIATGASADAIVLNQWYTGAFAMPSPAPLTAGVNDGFLGTDGPVLPDGFADAVLAPATPWAIVLSQYATRTVTDVEASGDFFQMFDNGLPMIPAPSPFTAVGQNPGQAGRSNGFTSVPTIDAPFDRTDINVALGDADFSSGTFYLFPGKNVITGEWQLNPSEGTGEFDFIAEPYAGSVPEPSTWALMLLGFAGLGFAGYRIARKGAGPAV